MWKFIGILVSIILAFASYNLIELKFSRLKTSRFLNITLLSIVILIFLFSIKISQSSGYSWRFNKDVSIASNEANNKYDLKRFENCKMDNTFKFKICSYGNYAENGLILYGDSHASAIISSLSEATRTNIVYFINQCPVIFDSELRSKTSSKRCSVFHNQFKEFIKTSNFWADTWAITTIEKKLNIKIIILSEEAYNNKDMDSIMICGQLNDQELENKAELIDVIKTERKKVNTEACQC